MDNRGITGSLSIWSYESVITVYQTHMFELRIGTQRRCDLRFSQSTNFSVLNFTTA